MPARCAPGCSHAARGGVELALHEREPIRMPQAAGERSFWIDILSSEQ